MAGGAGVAGGAGGVGGEGGVGAAASRLSGGNESITSCFECIDPRMYVLLVMDTYAHVYPALWGVYAGSWPVCKCVNTWLCSRVGKSRS